MRAGALREIYKYDENGRLRIRESIGCGDHRVDSVFALGDNNAVHNGTLWDPRADIDDDGDVDGNDATARAANAANWPKSAYPTVARAFSDFGNRFGRQGRPHYAIDTAPSATDGQLMLLLLNSSLMQVERVP